MMKLTYQELQKAIFTEEGARITKIIPLSEEIFKDHFPHHPVMPVALICELLYQLTTYWVFKRKGNAYFPLITNLDRCYTYEKLIPPALLALEICVNSLVDRKFMIDAAAFLEERQKIFTGQFTLALFPAKDFSKTPWNCHSNIKSC